MREAVYFREYPTTKPCTDQRAGPGGPQAGRVGLPKAAHRVPVLQRLSKMKCTAPRWSTGFLLSAVDRWQHAGDAPHGLSSASPAREQLESVGASSRRDGPFPCESARRLQAFRQELAAHD